MKIFIIPVLILLGFGLKIGAQINHGGRPYSFTHTGLAAQVPQLATPPVNLAQEYAIDELYYLEKGRSTRFGKEYHVSYDIYNSGLWEILPNSDRLWRVQIHCPDAISINFIFSQFYLPAHSRLYIYNPDHSHVLGAFNASTNTPQGVLGTTLLKGETAIIEYYEPFAAMGQGMLEIGTIIHGYRDLFGFDNHRGYGDSGSCNININCPLGNDWQQEKKAVAKILNGGFDYCTGTIVNNVREDGIPYFLTAAHCASSFNVASWVFVFNYESAGCTNQNGPTNQTVSGCTQKAIYEPSDFVLLQLNNTPPTDYDVYFAGWDANNTPPTSGVAISHPSGDIKKIAYDDDPLTSSVGLMGGTNNTHWRVGNYEQGTTESGSSGCAIWNQNHRVVGELSGGLASCSTPNEYDVYGKFSYSWNTGSSASSRLKDWLDPDNTGILVMDGKGACTANSFDIDGAIEAISGPQGQVCNGPIIPVVSFTNLGEETFTQIVFSYYIDTNSPELELWEGAASSCSNSNLSLPSIDPMEGNHTYTICIVNIDGQPDGDPSNNCLTSNFNCPSLPLTASFTSSDQQVCAGEPITFFGNALNGTPTAWNWTFEGGTPQTSNLQNPVVTYASNGVFNVSLSIIEGVESDVQTNVDYIEVLNNPTVAIESTVSTPLYAAQVVVTAYNANGPFTYAFNNNPASSINTTFLNAGDHTVTVTSVDGCSTIQHFSVSYSGISDLAKAGIEIMPNPASEYFNISFPIATTAELQIFDITGKLVYKNSQAITGRIDLPTHICSGIYMLTIKFEGQFYPYKLQVVR